MVICAHHVPTRYYRELELIKVFANKIRSNNYESKRSLFAIAIRGKHSSLAAWLPTFDYSFIQNWESKWFKPVFQCEESLNSVWFAWYSFRIKINKESHCFLAPFIPTQRFIWTHRTTAVIKIADRTVLVHFSTSELKDLTWLRKVRKVWKSEIVCKSKSWSSSVSVNRKRSMAHDWINSAKSIEMNVLVSCDLKLEKNGVFEKQLLLS